MNLIYIILSSLLLTAGIYGAMAGMLLGLEDIRVWIEEKIN